MAGSDPGPIWCLLEFERLGQKLVNRELGPAILARPGKDLRVLAGEFPNTLTAATAGRANADFAAATRNCNCGNLPAACGDHGRDRCGFGTAAKRVGCVFDVAAAVQSALVVDQGGAYAIAGVGRIRLITCLRSGIYQSSFVHTHELLRRGPGAMHGIR